MAAQDLVLEVTPPASPVADFSILRADPEWRPRQISPAGVCPTLPQLLPVAVRCYVSCFRCLARNARSNTMSHLASDAVFVRRSLARNA